MPWGISESGYNMTDAQMNYQYRAFGIPGLGFKRGLADDLVIAPYATVMAVMVNPEAACENMERLAADSLLGRYGFYEAVDYTPGRIPNGQTRGGAIVHVASCGHELPFAGVPDAWAADAAAFSRRPRIQSHGVIKLRRAWRARKPRRFIRTPPTCRKARAATSALKR